MRRAILVLMAGCALSGCAMNAKGLAKGKVRATYSSQKPPKDLAVCIANSLNWQQNIFEESPNHWVITRSHNLYGAPTVRWDIFASTSGSTAELRSSLGMFMGKNKVEACL
jgi:hypothetical protein